MYNYSRENCFYAVIVITLLVIITLPIFYYYYFLLEPQENVISFENDDNFRQTDHFLLRILNSR